ncbi:MAG: hypothetical protein KFW07_04300 [Mycoplasmataceae bacterium]|nr:hypothetical protein [Mycoplasmataceae bacterium]
MKKWLLSGFLLPIITLPTVVFSSCGTTSQKTYQDQYNLFTPELVINDNVGKNLAFSIDNVLIKNIYKAPEKLATGITYFFSFEPSNDGGSLKLFVQLFDYSGDLIPYSESSNKKEIMIITGFKKLTIAEQESIDKQYKDLLILNLIGDASTLPSSIKSFEDIKGYDKYIKEPKYNYHFELIPNDVKGTLEISLTLTSSLNNYPLRQNIFIEKENKIVSNYKTTHSLQNEIDNIYKEIINIDIKDYPLTTKVPLASSVYDAVSLVNFYNKINTENPLNQIPIPDFLISTTAEKYTMDLTVDSFDSEGRVSLNFNFFDKKTGNLLTPSSSVSRSKFINNFQKPSLELLKATMDAYNLYSNISSNELYKNKLPSLVDKTLSIGVFSNISERLTKEFTVVVNNFLTPSSSETFNFLPTITRIYDNDEDGIILFSVSLEVKINGINFLIKPPSSINESNPIKPTFSKSKNINNFNVNNFLTTELNDVNKTYEEINAAIKALAMQTIVGPSITTNNSNSINFSIMWNDLYVLDKDPLGLFIENPFNKTLEIKYEFIKKNPNDNLYEVFTSVVDGKIYKWVNIKASVFSRNNSNYEYDFLNINGILNPSFEFKLAVKLT